MAFKDWLPPWAGGADLASRTDMMDVGGRGPLQRAPQGIQSAQLPPTFGPTDRPIANEDEFGVSGTENYGGYIRREDFNPELDNFQFAVKIYDKMRRSDAQIHSILQVLKLPLRAATWVAIPPAGGDSVDQKIADKINEWLFDDDAMLESWDDTLRHILLMLDFGFSCMEKVWRVDDEGNYRLKRLAPRLPRTIRRWHVNRDGTLVAVEQYAPVPYSTSRLATGQQRTPTYTTSVSFQWLTIPADYICVFSLEREGDAYEGRSVLRSVYRNWWAKDQAYRLMTVGLDRWAVGIPVAQLEENHHLTRNELATLAEVLKAMRANEKAYAVAPPHVKYEILGGSSQGVAPPVMPWIDHLDTQMSSAVLARFMTMGSPGQTGTLGFGSRLTDLFVSSLNGVAKGISAELKKQIIRPLCYLNFDMTKRQLPSVVCRDLEQFDMAAMVQALVDLKGWHGGDYLTPDDEIESILRKSLKFPPLASNMTRRAIAESKVQATRQQAQATGSPVGATAGADGGEGGGSGGGAAGSGAAAVAAAQLDPPEASPEDVARANIQPESVLPDEY